MYVPLEPDRAYRNVPNGQSLPLHPGPAQTLMPLICDLWDKLYMPLVYRSRFFMHFKGQKVIYLEMEHRRLEWRYSKVLDGQQAMPFGTRPSKAVSTPTRLQRLFE